MAGESDTTDCSDTILTDEEIITHHHALGADFGNVTPLQVVQKGLLKAACGWHNGGTCDAILQHHGLIKRTGGSPAKLTKKGKAYLWQVYEAAIPVVI